MRRFSIAIVVASLALALHVAGAQSGGPPSLGLQHSVKLPLAFGDPKSVAATAAIHGTSLHGCPHVVVDTFVITISI
jgi:hypothetical protein